MRTLGKVSLVLGLTALCAAAAFGQPPGGGRPGGFGGGFGGPGGPGGTNPVTLIQMPQVREELKLTDEQLQKLPDAMVEALGKVLDDKQMTRLKQIVLQRQGTGALRRPEIQASLGLSDEQKETIAAIVQETEKESKALMENATEGQARFEAFRKAGTLRNQMNDKIKEVLTSQQKNQWEGMLGEELKLDFGGFGGGRPGFGGQGGQGNRPGAGEGRPRRPGGNQQGQAPRRNDT